MTEAQNITEAFEKAGGNLDLAAVYLSWTRTKLVDRAAKHPECRSWLEQRAPSDTEVLAASDVAEIPKAIRSDREMAAVLTKAAADFQIGLGKIGLDQKRAEYVMSVQMLARTSFRELVESTHGGVFKNFIDCGVERENASALLRVALDRLGDCEEQKERNRILGEIVVLNQVVRSIDASLARINELMQNSIYAVAMQKINDGTVKRGKLKFATSTEVANE